jgi:hypothetical protein
MRVPWNKNYSGFPGTGRNAGTSKSARQLTGEIWKRLNCYQHWKGNILPKNYPAAPRSDTSERPPIRTRRVPQRHHLSDDFFGFPALFFHTLDTVTMNSKSEGTTENTLPKPT